MTTPPASMQPPAPARTPAAASPKAASVPSAFVERIIAFLLPYFFTTPEDVPLVRVEILQTLASYGARSRAEMLNAARIIANSFSSLELLAEAASNEMSNSMRLRYRGCANSLNRSAQKDEAVLAKRLRTELPAEPAPQAEPVNDLSEEDFDAETAQVRATLLGMKAYLAGARGDYARGGLLRVAEDGNDPEGGAFAADPSSGNFSGASFLGGAFPDGEAGWNPGPRADGITDAHGRSSPQPPPTAG